MDQPKFSSMMEENRIFPPSPELMKNAHIKSMDEYRKMYKASIDNPEKFWGEMALNLDWFKKWDKVLVADFANAKHQWFVGGKLNASYNCVDRHTKTWRKNKAAIIWEGDIGDRVTLTYQDLYTQINRFANVLKKHGVKKGDRVSIYLPMIPELPIAMLACARIGAIHSVVFGGFSGDALRDRIQSCESNMLICTDGYYRSGKVVKSKDNADAALKECPTVKEVIVVKRTNHGATMVPGRDTFYQDEMAAADIKSFCEPAQLDSEDPLFILYTSGSTGKPKGVMHTQAGYLLYTMLANKYVFDLKDEDTYWCTADIGWITGHSCIVYGPLANGTTTVMFEGVPNYPAPDRFWDIVEKYKVSIFYTAPTALRAMMKDGDEFVNKHDLSALRILGSVGEPINPEAWMWYYNVIGKGKCPIMDTYWQTETGCFMMTPLPITPLKPGSACLPFFGIDASIIREDRTLVDKNEGGYLVLNKPWPGLMRGVWGEPDRFKKTYFEQFPGVYTTGDGARWDDDGYIWLMGRIDDVIKISGHRIGTAEVESALVSHPSVAEAAVVPVPHPVKGSAIYAFVTVKNGVEKTDALKKELIGHVRATIGPIATPDKIQWADGLPKTRSGKIMRRILTKIAGGDGNLGDTSTLADPAVVDVLVKGRQP